MQGYLEPWCAYLYVRVSYVKLCSSIIILLYYTCRYMNEINIVIYKCISHADSSKDIAQSAQYV